MPTVVPGICWWVLSVALCVSAPALADEATLARFESTQPHMGVPFKLVLYAADQTAANAGFEAAFARIAALDAALSDYQPDSELNRLSRTAPAARAVPVSEDLWRVLERSHGLAARTLGAFDVTVGPYVRLWRRARRQGQLPSAERLAEARPSVGYQHVELDAQARAVRLLAPSMHLDLGGIAMGYAVDEALATLRARGITRALVDASGDIGAGDPPPERRGWRVAVVPLSADGTPSREILLANAAVTTAGDAYQHVEIDGIRYSHIVDPRTGLGVTDRSGVTVVARDCMTADSVDTAVNVLGPKAGLELVQSIPGAAAFIVRPTADGKLETFESPGFSQYVVPASDPVRRDDARIEPTDGAAQR